VNAEDARSAVREVAAGDARIATSRREARPLETCLFDLDGTLIDSIELIYRSYEHTYAAFGMSVPPRTELVHGLGRPLEDQFRRDEAGEARDARLVSDLIATYRRFNLAHHDDLVRAYPGVREGLVALRDRGVRLGIVTSKGGTTARRGLTTSGLDGLFEIVVALEDCTRHKPDPEPVLNGLARLRADAATSAYVGDSPHDMASGRGAGVRVFGVAWGPFPRTHFAGVHVDRWLEAPRDMAQLA